MTTYAAIAQRALEDEAYRQGLEDAAAVARANRGPDHAPCPSSMVAVYLEQLANGEGRGETPTDLRADHRRGGESSPPEAPTTPSRARDGRS